MVRSRNERMDNAAEEANAAVKLTREQTDAANAAKNAAKLVSRQDENQRHNERGPSTPGPRGW